MKILSRFSLNVRIFVLPVILLIIGYILVLGVNTWIVAHNAKTFLNNEFALLVDAEKRPLEAGMRLIISVSSKDALMAMVENKDASGVSELLAQAQLVGAAGVVVLDKNGAVIYPSDGKVATEISDLLNKATKSKGLVETGFAGSDLVTYGTIFRDDAFLGIVAFTAALPPGLMSTQAFTTGQVSGSMDINARALKVQAAWSQFKRDALLGSIAICVWCILFLIVTFFINTKSLLNTFRNVSQSLTHSSGGVLAASTSIASSAQELSSAATEQASSLEQTASAIEELTGMVMKNNENALMASQGSQESRASAEAGKEAVGNMIQVIDDISASNKEIIDQINESNHKIEGIVQVIAEIENKTKIINEIVFQTKLLSFNASVEAARAGEHGKGFAVVAEEIGNLSLMSGNAAKEISEILDDSINKVELIIRETRENVNRLVESGKAKVDKGTHAAHQCGDVLSTIYDSVSAVAGMTLEISSASDQQSKAVQEISKAMHQLEKATHQNSQTAMSSASASEELSGHAQSMEGLVTMLYAVVEGAKESKGI